ncbi:MAG: glycosyltransferase family 4 protein [Bacteroidaceae bacterium]|jgi:Glycosyltransferase|nr:glycosyltransferase family 4 protein [Bacteroidaceae bacterium]MBR6857301.1 glycosyltransferase family 4 protein [Bacteroidaceae bacterium]
MKKVLIDLTILKHINCGLGQIAYNYARFYGENAGNLEFEVHFLLPRQYVGAFGNDVHYHASSWLYDLSDRFIPKFDVWHSIHQLCRHMPSRKSTPFLLTIHDINFIYEKSGKSLERQTGKFLKRLKRADRIVYISDFTRNDILNHFPTDTPQEIIYNGVEFGDPQQERRPVLPFDENSKYLFTIGQIRQKKNFHVLLDAMKLLPQYKLVIAGEKGSAYADMIEERIKAEGIDNVFLIGTVHNSEKIWLYNHCEAFVFPSMFEGFGLPVIEAMSFGKPVVSSDMTSLKEICSGHAFILENFEADHIAGKITQAIDTYSKDPALVAQNTEYARSFTYRRHMDEYLRIYREMLQ